MIESQVRKGGWYLDRSPFFVWEKSVTKRVWGDELRTAEFRIMN